MRSARLRRVTRSLVRWHFHDRPFRQRTLSASFLQQPDLDPKMTRKCLQTCLMFVIGALLTTSADRAFAQRKGGDTAPAGAIYYRHFDPAAPAGAYYSTLRINANGSNPSVVFPDISVGEPSHA